MKRLPLIAAIALAAAACVPGVEPDNNSFSEFAELPDAEWPYARACRFIPATTADSIVRGTLLLSLRHTASYPYSNLWIELAQGEPDDSVPMLRDTFDIAIADPFGRWLGSGMGASLRRTDTLSRDFTLVRGRRLTVRHIMRTDTLDGIEQVGLVFIPDKDSDR